MKKEYGEPDSHIYIDMDGCLAKWNEKASEEETHEKGYFLSREPQENLIKAVKKLSKFFDVKILTSTYKDDHSRKEKKEWCKNNGLSSIPVIFVPYGEDKYKYIDNCESGMNYLIDDFGKNLTSWESQGKNYISIKFMNQVNSRPKIEVDENGVMNLKEDSWTGYRLDHRMTSDQIFKNIAGLYFVCV